MIELLSEWGNQPHYATGKVKIKEVLSRKALLRECPGCGREVLRHRQRLCDDCRRIQRQKTKRESYYKSKRL